MSVSERMSVCVCVCVTLTPTISLPCVPNMYLHVLQALSYRSLPHPATRKNILPTMHRTQQNPIQENIWHIFDMTSMNNIKAWIYDMTWVKTSKVLLFLNSLKEFILCSYMRCFTWYSTIRWEVHKSSCSLLCHLIIRVVPDTHTHTLIKVSVTNRSMFCCHGTKYMFSLTHFQWL